MPFFRYAVLDEEGLERKGTLWATTQEEASQKLLKRYGVIIKLTPFQGLKLFQRLVFSPKYNPKHVSQKQLLAFTRQLTLLVQAKVHLLKALEMILEQTKHAALKHVLEVILEHLKNGLRLSDVLQFFPTVFDEFYVSMVVCGEKSGHLEQTLPKICELIERRLKTRKSIQLALIYPVFVTTLALVIAYLFILYVIPKFQLIFFQNTTIQLPLFTLAIFKFSQWLDEHTIILLTCLIGIVGFGFAFVTKIMSRTFLSRILMKLPYFGCLFQLLTLHIFFYNLGLFLDNGVPILTALDLIRKAIQLPNYQNAVATIRDTLGHGIQLSQALSIHTALFPAVAVHLVKVGEETGQLNAVLNQLAMQFESDSQQLIKQFIAFLEPALMIVLSLFIGGLILALFIPLSQVLQNPIM